MNTALPQVERVELGDLVCWRVRSAGAELLVAQQGAQVLSYQRNGEPPLLWLSPHAAYQHGQPARGGVPVCWPWFGDLARNPLAVQAQYSHAASAPAHGWVRDLDWQLLGIDSVAHSVCLSFACKRPETGLPGWPAGLELSLRIRLDEGLSLSLRSHNRGSQPVVLSQALHSYFAVSDIRQVRVEGLQDCSYRDTLDGWQARQQHGPLQFTGETDRIYLQLPSRLSIVDPQWQRRILLESSGSTSAVVWNPWIDKAQRLSQFPADAWTGMLCIETANVLDDVLHLAPGECQEMAVRLSSEPLVG